MKYLFLIFLVVFFEYLGASIQKLLRFEKPTVHFAVGFLSFIALLYVALFSAVSLKLSFVIIMTIITIAFIIGVALIIYEKPKLHFSKEQIVVLLVVSAFYVFVQYNTSLGDQWASDLTSYIEFNTNYINGVYTTYAFQSYYQLLAYITKILGSYYNAFGRPFLYTPIYVWYGSIFNYLCEVVIILNIFETLDIQGKAQKTVFYIVSFFFLGMTIDRLGAACIGNMYRLFVCGLLFNYVYLYFESLENRYLIMIGIISISLCALANNHIFIVSLFSFVFWVLSSKSRNTILFVCIWLFIPILNLVNLYILFLPIRIAIFCAGISIIFLIYKLKNQIHTLINKGRNRNILLIIVFFLVTIPSLILDRFTLNSFFNNVLSHNWDLMWKYNVWDSPYQIVGNTLLLIPIVIAFIYRKKNDVFLMMILLVILFMTPLQAGLFNKINIVFFRYYDLVINPFTIIYAYSALLMNINIKKQTLALIAMLISSCYLCYENIQIIRNNTNNIIKTGYNPIKKMTEDEYNVTLFLKDYINNNEIINKRIITYLPLQTNEIFGYKQMYGRLKQLIDNRYPELTKVFFPVEYNSLHTDVKQREYYENVYNYLLKSDYDLVLLDKSIEYEDSDNHYLAVYTKLNESIWPVYENDSYAIYHIRH